MSTHRPHKKCYVVIKGKDCLTVYFALDKDESLTIFLVLVPNIFT